MMKITSTILSIGILAFLLSTQAYASDAKRTSEELEHVGQAKAYGADSHAKILLEHAKKKLAHAKAAGKEHTDGYMHMDKAIRHLNGAIENSERGRSDVANKHTNEAMQHLKESGY